MSKNFWDASLFALLPIVLLTGIEGCNTAPENHVPPTAESRAKTITDNPHMSQAQKDDALGKIQQTQNYSNAVGGARNAMSGSKKSGQ